MNEQVKILRGGQSHSMPANEMSLGEYIRHQLGAITPAAQALYAKTEAVVLTEIITAAFEMRRNSSGTGGQNLDASNGQRSSADVPDANSGEDGHTSSASVGLSVNAIISGHQNQDEAALRALPTTAICLPPPRPGTRRTIESAHAASVTHINSFLKTYKLRGCILGDLTISELKTMEGETAFELRLIRLIKGHAANGDGDMLVYDILTEEKAQEYVKRAMNGDDDA
jgi:hypothetical protein